MMKDLVDYWKKNAGNLWIAEAGQGNGIYSKLI